MNDEPDYEPGASEILLWRLARLWAWSADGRLAIPPDEWDIPDVDSFAGGGIVPSDCVEFEVQDGCGRRWHLSTGEVLLFSPSRRFPFELVSLSAWAGGQERLDHLAGHGTGGPD